MNITERSENPRQVFRLNVPSKYIEKLRELGIERFGIDPGSFNGASVWQSYDYDSDTAGVLCELSGSGGTMVLMQKDVQAWDLHPSNKAHLAPGKTYTLGPAVSFERKWKPIKGKVTGVKCVEHMFGLWEATTEPPVPMNRRIGS